MLLTRAYHFGRRLLAAVLSKFYLWMLVIPWLRIRGVLSRPFAVRPAYGGAVVVEQERLYKVALSSRSTIGIAYTNYVNAGRRWPELLAVLADCELKDEKLFSYLSMTRYQPIGLERAISFASGLYQLMGTCRSPNSPKMASGDSQELIAGLEIISKLYDRSTSRAVHELVESFLDSGDYHLGFAHGDFHSRNILVDANGNPRLIDLDCIRLNGIQELDALYFVLEAEWSKSGTLWYRTIVDLLRGNVPSLDEALLSGFGVANEVALGVTYLVDRIGQETRNFGFRYTRDLLDPAIEQILSADRQVAKLNRPTLTP